MIKGYDGRLVFDGAVVGYDKGSTPHYMQTHGTPNPRESQDYGLYIPGVGLVAGDGMGGRAGGAAASRTVVRATVDRAQVLRVSEMPSDEATDAVRNDVLPYADRKLAEAKDRLGLEAAGTTLGAVLLARHNVAITVGTGDTPVLGLMQKMRQGMLQARFGELTAEQGMGHVIANTFEGNGRPPAGGPLGDNPDQVHAFPVFPGTRFLIPTDGLLGDRPHERLPEQYEGANPLESLLCLKGLSALDIAQKLAYLPAALDRLDVQVPVEEADGTFPYDYIPKYNDLLVGVLLAEAQR